MIAELRSAEPKLNARAGKKEGGWGEGIFARPRFSAAEFRISLCEMRRLFTIFDFWCSIKVVERKYHRYFNSTTTILVCQT